MGALTTVRPTSDDQYAPSVMQDLVDFAIDQDSPSGVFTRLAPTVAFSHTPSYAARPTDWPGTSFDDISGQQESARGHRPHP